MDPELQMKLSQRLAQRIQALKARGAGQVAPEAAPEAVPDAEPGSALDTVDSGALVNRLERIRMAARRRNGGRPNAGR